MPGPVGNDSERFRTVPGSQVYLNLIVLQVLRLCDYIILIVFLHINLRTMLPCGRDFIFSAWQAKLKAKNHRRTFPKHSLQVARGRANRTMFGMWLWKTSLSTCSFAIWSRRRPHVTGMFLLFAGVMRGSWQQRYIESPLVLLHHRHSYSTNSQYSFQDLQYRFQDGF